MALLSGGPASMLPAKWRRYPVARLERYVQNGAIIRMADFTHRLSKSRKKLFSYNIYGFAINRIGFSVGVKVVEKLFFECENKSRCQ